MLREVSTQTMTLVKYKNRNSLYGVKNVLTIPVTDAPATTKHVEIRFSLSLSFLYGALCLLSLPLSPSLSISLSLSLSSAASGVNDYAFFLSVIVMCPQ